MRRVAPSIAFAASALLAACEFLVGTTNYELAREGGAASDASSDGAPTDDGALDDGSRSPSDAGTEANIPTFGSVETIASEQRRPNAIAMDAVHAYWVNDDTYSIHRAPKGGGTTELVLTATAGGPPRFALDLLDIFYVQDANYCETSILRRAKSGDASVAIPLGGCAQSMTPRSAAIDAVHFYFTDARNHQVRRVAKGPAPSTTEQVVGTANAPRGLAVAASAAYYTSLGASEVKKTPLPFTNLDASVVFAPAQPGALSVAADATQVVWTTDTTIVRADLDGGLSTIAESEAGPASVALFDGVVYWVNAGDGTVRAFGDGSTQPTTLASGHTGASSIAVDATGVYWTTATGKVLRLPR